MRYLLLIYSDETRYPRLSAQENDKLLAEYRAFSTKVQGAGKHIASDRLQPTTTATTIRIRNGETLTTDGPFAETKEQLGGFFMIEAKDLDEATAWAAQIPSAKYGSVEVRPIWERSA
jgi:hypothetical protein